MDIMEVFALIFMLALSVGMTAIMLLGWTNTKDHTVLVTLNSYKEMYFEVPLVIVGWGSMAYLGFEYIAVDLRSTIILLASIAIAVGVLAFVLIKPAEEEGAPPKQTPSTALPVAPPDRGDAAGRAGPKEGP